MDNFETLSNRLLNRCPSVGIALSQQLVNDAWATLQARRPWSFRRRHGTFAPPTIYSTGTVSSNVSIGAPNLLTGVGTAWTVDMIGRQIRVGGLLYPFYTIVGWQDSTHILIDKPWAGPDVAGQTYSMVQCFYTVPEDFGYWETIVSIKDGYRLWTNVTESDLALMDPQRTNFGQTYAVAFLDYASSLGGIIGPALNVTNPANPMPISTSTLGYSYPADAVYIVQVVTGGTTGTATFQWMRGGQTAFQFPTVTQDTPQDLSDGVQIYWPDGVAYVSGDLFIIQCRSLVSGSAPRFEFWPAPTFSGYLYPYIYVAKEQALSPDAPQLPPFIANRGEVLLEMALEKCAEYPGPDASNPNVYYNLKQAQWHRAKYSDMLIDLERNDEEVGVTNVDYQMFPMYPAPWFTGQWQQTHAPFMNG